MLSKMVGCYPVAPVTIREIDSRDWMQAKPWGLGTGTTNPLVDHDQ